MNKTKRLPYKRAICYSGFRDGQSPDAGVFPSESEILEDLRLLEGHWDALRVYACDLHTERVLKVIERENLPFTVMLGAYIGAEVNNPNCPWGGVYSDEILAKNRINNQQELDRAVAWANRYESIVDIVSVGNEATVDWTDHLIEPEAVTAMRPFCVRISQPVTFCENYVPWLDKLTGLAEELDVIAIHTYPVWEYKTVAEQWNTPARTSMRFRAPTRISRSSSPRLAGPQRRTGAESHQRTSVNCFRRLICESCSIGPRKKKYWFISLKLSTKTGKDRTIP